MVNTGAVNPFETATQDCWLETKEGAASSSGGVPPQRPIKSVGRVSVARASRTSRGSPSRMSSAGSDRDRSPWPKASAGAP